MLLGGLVVRSDRSSWCAIVSELRFWRNRL